MFQATKHGDIGVFGCKLVPDDLEEFIQTADFFVDSSGWGQEDEPALTREQFLEKVTQDRYYAITGQGQFQVHVGEFIKKE